MDREETDLWHDVQFRTEHLSEAEIQHEFELRRLHGPDATPLQRQTLLHEAITYERENGCELSDVFQIGPKSPTIHVQFGILLADIKHIFGPIFDQCCDDPSAVSFPETISRLYYYRQRLMRFPESLYNSNKGISIRKSLNRLLRLSKNWQKSMNVNAVANELVEDLVTGTQLNSTVIPPTQQVTNNERPDNNISNAHSSISNPSMEQPLHHPESVQTSESFRISPSFNAYAAQATPPCARAPVVQFQTATTIAQPSSSHSNWSFQSQDHPHSTRSAMTNVTGAHTQPRPSIQPMAQSTMPPPMMTIPLMPHEMIQTRSMDQTHNISQHQSSFMRQAGAELQALKRWLGPKTFEGDLVDSKHFSIDEFLNHLKLCVQSGICSEETMLRNLAPAFTGRAFGWWTTTYGRIHTFSQLTAELQLRFATYAGSIEGLMATIYGRRQQKNESLPDFVDTMQVLMDQLPEHFTQAVRISTIISCALPEESRLLRSRHYSDIADFTRHVAFLSQNRPKFTTDKPEKRMIRDKPVYLCDFDNDESDSDSNNEDEGFDIQAITTAFQKSLAGLKIKRPNKPGSEQKKSKYQSKLDTRAKDRHTTASDMNARKSKIQCFGCGAPDVYFSSCEKCQTNLTGNNPKREIFCFGCGTPNVYYTNCDSCQTQISKNFQPGLNATNKAPAK